MKNIYKKLNGDIVIKKVWNKYSTIGILQFVESKMLLWKENIIRLYPPASVILLIENQQKLNNNNK